MARVAKWLKRLSAASLFIFLLLMLALHSCITFRMSKSEIDTFFADKPQKGTLHTYLVDKQKINYLHVGDEQLPLVVFVHGSPGSLSAFIDFMANEALLKQAQLVTVDRPGFGASNFGYAEPSLQKQAAALKPILEKYQQARPIILVGHSLGGPVIARMAMDYPQLVDGLVFVAASVDPDLEPNEWFRGPLATPFLKWILPRSLRASNDELYQLKPQLQAMLPLWPDIKVPAIVVQGGKDSLVPPGNADFIVKRMVNANVNVVLQPDMNHFVPWTHPQLIANAVLELLAQKKVQ
jgi:pimeloyl-ACP methyl ester carboxylesterase